MYGAEAIIIALVFAIGAVVIVWAFDSNATVTPLSVGIVGVLVGVGPDQLSTRPRTFQSPRGAIESPSTLIPGFRCHGHVLPSWVPTRPFERHRLHPLKEKTPQ